MDNAYLIMLVVFYNTLVLWKIKSRRSMSNNKQIYLKFGVVNMDHAHALSKDYNAPPIEYFLHYMFAGWRVEVERAHFEPTTSPVTNI